MCARAASHGTESQPALIVVLRTEFELVDLAPTVLVEQRKCIHGSEQLRRFRCLSLLDGPADMHGVGTYMLFATIQFVMISRFMKL